MYSKQPRAPSREHVRSTGRQHTHTHAHTHSREKSHAKVFFLSPHLARGRTKKSFNQMCKFFCRQTRRGKIMELEPLIHCPDGHQLILMPFLSQKSTPHDNIVIIIQFGLSLWCTLPVPIFPRMQRPRQPRQCPLLLSFLSANGLFPLQPMKARADRQKKRRPDKQTGTQRGRKKERRKKLLYMFGQLLVAAHFAKRLQKLDLSFFF